jgi:alkaline phosphatase
MPRIHQKLLAVLFMCLSAAATLAQTPLSGTAQPQPAVRGPEQPDDWMRAGNGFIERVKKLAPGGGQAKNVILFVGDGMGISTITAARILQGQLAGKSGEENSLSFEAFANLALSKTYSWDQQTSDSAPTITAIVTGYKTREGMLSVDHTTARYEGDAKVIAAKAKPTILELAARAGRDVGMVSTARLTHATPAGHYAHIAARDWESDQDIRRFEQKQKLPLDTLTVKDIALQLLEADPAVAKQLKLAWGGGRTNFIPSSQNDPESGKPGRRLDNRDLTQEWIKTRGQGAAYVWNKAQFDAINPATTGPVLGLFEDSHMQFEADRQRDKAGEPSLTEMTAKAIQMLKKNPKGFYLHVEAGRIDHAHHGNNAYRALTDTIELSNAVNIAMELTDPRDTLIIVTADHSHVFTIAGYPHRGNPILGLVSDVPELDGGAAELSKDKLGLPYTTLSYANGSSWRDPATLPGKRPDLNAVNTTAPEYQQEATVPLGAETHGGEDVAIFANGAGAQMVRGVMEQNWIFHVMREAMGLK